MSQFAICSCLMLIIFVIALPQTEGDEIKCSHDWEAFGNFCYYFNSEQTHTYNESRDACIEEFATLTSVHSTEEQTFLAQWDSTSNFWIGLNDREENDTYIWEDGSQYDFQAWHSGEPSSLVWEKCVHLWAEHNNKWNDIWCYFEAGYICKRPAGDYAGDVQLVDGPRPNVGRLEFLRLVNETTEETDWNTVCDDYMGHDEAEVVCRQLGQPFDHATPIIEMPFTPGDSNLVRVNCDGTEPAMDECTIEEEDSSSDFWLCYRHEEVGVNCIRDDDPPPKLALEDGRGDQSGRLLIDIFGEWGTVCSNGEPWFGDNEAKVACRQLGLPHRHVTYYYPGPGNETRPTVYSEVVCNGDEERLDMCQHIEYPDTCTHAAPLVLDYIETYDGVLASSSWPRQYFRIQEGAIVKFYCPIRDETGLNTANDDHARMYWWMQNDVDKYEMIGTEVEDRIQMYGTHGFGFNGKTGKRVSILTYTARREDNGKFLECDIEDTDKTDSIVVDGLPKPAAISLLVLPGPTPQHFQSTVGDVWPGGFSGKIHVPIDDAYYTSWKIILKFPKKVFRLYGTNFNVAPEPCLHKGACTKSFYTWVIWNTYENRVLSPLCELDLHFIASTSKNLGRGHGRGLVADVKFYGFNKVFGADYPVDDAGVSFRRWPNKLPNHDQWFKNNNERI